MIGLFASCSDPAAPIDAGPPDDAAPDNGRFSVEWRIVDGANEPVTCDQLGSVTIRLRATPVGGGTVLFDGWSCKQAATELTGERFPEGMYDVALELRSVSAALVEPVDLGTVTIQAGRVTSLGPATFQVDPMGRFQLFLNTAETGDNCNEHGITSVRLSLHEPAPSSVCVPVTFELGFLGATYDSDCLATHSCIEREELITSRPLTAGAYVLNAVGLVGTAECWSTTINIQVPPNNQRTDLGFVSMTRDSKVPGCAP